MYKLQMHFVYLLPDKCFKSRTIRLLKTNLQETDDILRDDSALERKCMFENYVKKGICTTFLTLIKITHVFKTFLYVLFLAICARNFLKPLCIDVLLYFMFTL